MSSNNNENVLDSNFQQHTIDEYVILLIATNPKKNSDTSKYPNFNINTTNTIQQIRNPNVTSTDNQKHIQSYGKYYGFGIINKYRIDHGISFGKFEGYKLQEENENNVLIKENIKSQFTFMKKRLNSVFKGNINCADCGNEQISLLIHFGRLSCINPKFNIDTNTSNFLFDKCFSIWLCKDAQTEVFHQELDASYTLIGIPMNFDSKDSESQCSYKFQFRWNSIDSNQFNGIDIGLFEGMVLYYNGFGLFHRQVPCSNYFEKKTFWILSMYHNYRLFNSISKTINRY